MTKRIGVFVAGVLVFWAACFAVALILWPDQREATLVVSPAALGLCLIPTLLTFLWSSWSLRQTPDQQLVTALGGTGLRMFFVLGVGLLLSSTVEALHAHRLQFWLWVLVLYLVTLALEMVLIVRAQVVTEKTTDAGTPTSVTR